MGLDRVCIVHNMTIWIISALPFSFFLSALFSSMKHSVTHCSYVSSFIYWLSIDRIVADELFSSSSVTQVTGALR